MEQPLALDAESTYLLRYEFKTEGLNSTSGIRWEAGDAREPLKAANEWTRGELEFPGGAKSLTLVYGRPAGETTAAGTVSLRRLEVVGK